MKQQPQQRATALSPAIVASDHRAVARMRYKQMCAGLSNVHLHLKRITRQ